jgi:hypothetical protein
VAATCPSIAATFRPDLPDLIPNGHIVGLSGNTKENAPHGTTVEIQCDDGYEPYASNCSPVLPTAALSSKLSGFILPTDALSCKKVQNLREKQSPVRPRSDLAHYIVRHLGS